MAFLAEIKRRRVGKVAIAYGAVAWAVTEAASVVLPALYVPEWAMTFLVIFLLVGFPIAMVLAWVFDVSATGIERTEPLPGAPPQMQFRTRAAFGVVVVVAMAGLGYLLYERGLGRAEAAGSHSSIAVLPFANLSGDASKDYFSDGMSEELLNLLARVPGLKVAARTSAFAYKGRNVDVREVGKELGVETVLEGSVRQSGDQVRITAQLIDAETGFHLWSETYDRRMADIFTVQDEIATAIVDKLKIELAPKEQQLAQRDDGAHPERRSLRALPAGTGHLEAPRRGQPAARHRVVTRPRWRAIPDSRARTRRWPPPTSCCLATRSEEGDEEKYLPMAEQSARQALALDPKIGEAHAVLAQINSERGNLLDAESGFFFAISLEPNEPTPHHWYSILLQKVGRLDAALEQARRAYELDPSAPILASNLANVYLMRGDDEQALSFSRARRRTRHQQRRERGHRCHGGDAYADMGRGEAPAARRRSTLPPELKSLVGHVR